jgi:hypothetical protein
MKLQRSTETEMSKCVASSDDEAVIQTHNDAQTATDLASFNEDSFLATAAQIYRQVDCEDARALLADGGRDIQIKLCRQLALTHEAAVKFLQRGMGEYNTVEAARLTNAAARLMSVFQQGVLALRNVQAGNDQRITFQQVNVSGGNTLVAANVKTGAALVPAGEGREEN